MKLAITFLSLAFVVGSISARGRRPRILGGDDANIENFPYQASLRMFGIHLCGGTIISEKHILTAAHCINVLSALMKVHTGTGSYNESGNVHNIADIKVHSDWEESKESSYRNDIAIITLTENILFDKYQNKINLPRKQVQSGVTAVLTGWGHISNEPDSSAMQLQKVEMTMVENVECQKDRSDEVYEEQLCAFHSNGVGACKGDSGGPLAVDGEVIGVVSWGHTDDCADGIPDIFTNVYAYKDFIESAMKEKVEEVYIDYRDE